MKARYILLIVVVLGTIFGADIKDKFFTDYSVETKYVTLAYGDTLQKVALRYADQQDKHKDLRAIVYDIENANNITARETYILQAGRKIAVPLYTKVK